MSNTYMYYILEFVITGALAFWFLTHIVYILTDNLALCLLEHISCGQKRQENPKKKLCSLYNVYSIRFKLPCLWSNIIVYNLAV